MAGAFINAAMLYQDSHQRQRPFAGRGGLYDSGSGAGHQQRQSGRVESDLHSQQHRDKWHLRFIDGDKFIYAGGQPDGGHDQCFFRQYF